MTLGSRFNPGGLFRCCVQTIIDDPGPDEIGRTMNCPFCDAPLVVVQGHRHPEWEWNREAEISMRCIRESINPDELDD